MPFSKRLHGTIAAMFVWSSLLAGPLLLPLAFWMRSDVSETVAEVMLLLGVVGLFLSICATEALGPTPAQRAGD